MTAAAPVRSLALLVHGEAGAGKSWLSNTAPPPRLYLDAENRAKYLADLDADPTGATPQQLVYWDPRKNIPADSGEKSVVTVVNVKGEKELALTMQWLKAGSHPFRAVTLDSVTVTQERIISTNYGLEQLRVQDWGEVLRKMQGWIRDFVDLQSNATRPIHSLTVLGGSHEKDDMQRVMLQGQLSSKIAYMFDTVGYLSKRRNESGEAERYMLIDGLVDGLVAKDNTHVLSLNYGAEIVNPNITAMLRAINPRKAS